MVEHPVSDKEVAKRRIAPPVQSLGSSQPTWKPEHEPLVLHAEVPPVTQQPPPLSVQVAVESHVSVPQATLPAAPESSPLDEASSLLDEASVVVAVEPLS